MNPPKGFSLKDYVNEAGGSGYSAAFTHPDPLDPNDSLRQRTQSRQGNFPYDSPVSYGGPIGTDMGGAAYQRAPDHTPPKPRNRKADSDMPYGEYGVAWEQVESLLDPYSPGEQADDAFSLGYGSHGRMGEEDLLMVSDDDAPPSLMGTFFPVPDRPGGLLGLLSHGEDEVELMDRDDDSDCDLYSDWGDHVYAPGAEDDPQ